MSEQETVDSWRFIPSSWDYYWCCWIWIKSHLNLKSVTIAHLCDCTTHTNCIHSWYHHGAKTTENIDALGFYKAASAIIVKSHSTPGSVDCITNHTNQNFVEPAIENHGSVLQNLVIFMWASLKFTRKFSHRQHPQKHLCGVNWHATEMRHRTQIPLQRLCQIHHEFTHHINANGLHQKNHGSQSSKAGCQTCSLYRAVTPLQVSPLRTASPPFCWDLPPAFAFITSLKTLV